ncbi:sulfotransferase family protein [Nostoc sp.]|uniref:sulfotransferase family protein n=1 Tax=Nostoc sp. TaxID=1180 RepID=UPI003593C857
MSKIFGIGLSKTGTSSLHNALELLGYSSVHFPLTWAAFDSHDAASDLPVACRFKELDERYPGSKFILTIRDMRGWLQSCADHFGHRVKLEQFPVQLRVIFMWHRQQVFGTVGYDPVLFEEAYLRHLEHVQQYFLSRPQDLLVLNICVGEGWKKLCPFLGYPILEVPFPHSNRASSLTKPNQDGNKGQIQGLAKGDIEDQGKFITQIFGVAT